MLTAWSYCYLICEINCIIGCKRIVSQTTLSVIKSVKNSTDFVINCFLKEMIVCCMSSAKLKTACPTVTRSLSRPFSSKNILGHVRKTWEIFVADHSCFTVIANRVQTAYVSIFFVFIRRGCLFTSSLIGTMALSLNIPLSVVMDILLRHVSCRTVVRFLLLPII